MSGYGLRADLLLLWLIVLSSTVLFVLVALGMHALGFSEEWVLSTAFVVGCAHIIAWEYLFYRKRLKQRITRAR